MKKQPNDRSAQADRYTKDSTTSLGREITISRQDLERIAEDAPGNGTLVVQRRGAFDFPDVSARASNRTSGETHKLRRVN